MGLREVFQSWYVPFGIPGVHAADNKAEARDNKHVLPQVCDKKIPPPKLLSVPEISLTHVTILSRNYDCPTRADFGLCTSSLNTLLSVVFTDFNSEVRTRTWYDVKASPIQIRFQATDSDVVPIPTDSFNLPPPPTPEELEREREEQRNAEQGGGLSSGEKAGIGVGVTLGVIFAMAATCGLCKRRRTKAHPSETIPLDNTSSERVNGSEAAPPPYTK